jgi:hypothetical protein
LLNPHSDRGDVNPPYSKGLLIQFVNKMIREVERKNVTAGIMLLNNFTDADWFHMACSACAAICFPRGRIYFENATGKIDRPLNGQVFFYYGNDAEVFHSEFSSIGFLVAPLSGSKLPDIGGAVS